MKALAVHKQLVVLLAILFLAYSETSFAQKRGSSLIYAIEKHDFGVFGGVATYLGDFNEKDLLYRPSFLAGLMYSYNINPYFALRMQGGFSRIKGLSADHYGSLPGFPVGGAMAFDRSMVMLDGGVEINFLPFSSVDQKRKNIFSPYLALGVGVNFMGNNSYNNNPNLDMAANVYPELYGRPGESFPQTIIFEIPIGLGVKVSPIKRFTLAGEWTFKKMFYDDVDGFTNRGGGSFNLINDDWVSTITVSLTYRFASNWRCEAYSTPAGSLKMRGLRDRTYKVNVLKSAAKDMKRAENAKMPKGRSESDNNRAKKKKR